MIKASVLDIQHWRTSKGTPVYFVRTPQLPMVDINLVFNAGAARDGDKLGIADLTCGLLDEGTAQFSADEIAQRFDSVGANYHAGIRQDSAYISLRSLVDPEFFNPALATFTDLLCNPAFSTASFERVRKQMLSGLEEDLQQPATIAQNAFYAALYPNHPYGHPISGNIASVNQLTREDVMDFYKRHYVASNVLIAMVGDIDIDHAKTITEQLVKDLPLGEVAPALSLAAVAPATSQSIAFPSQQTTIYLGQIGIIPKDPDYFSLLVGNYTLGSGGMVSRLFHEVREKKGLVYGVHSSFMPLLARGTFSMKLQTRNEEAQNAIDLTCEVTREFVQQGPTEAELAAAKKNILGGFPLELASNASILGQLVRIGFYQLPLDYLDTYRDTVAAVTQEQICAAFQKHVQLDKLVRVTVGR
jgi:zinc protease